MRLYEIADLTQFLVRNKSFERCQFGDEMRYFHGEAGYGIYAFPINSYAMEKYYSNNGEETYILKMKPNATMVDFTMSPLSDSLVAYIKRKFQERVADKENYPYYKPPSVSKSTIQRFGNYIEDVVRLKFPDVSGWIVPHNGPGIPSGKQAVIRKIEDFDIKQKGQ